MKRIISLLSVIFIIFSSAPAHALNYDVNGAYTECYTLYPVFIENVLSKGTTKEKVIIFMEDVRDYLSDLPEELNEENFDLHFYDGINHAFTFRRNIKVRDALMAAYPDATTDALDGKISEEFMPVYNTVKRFILGISTPVISLSVKDNKTSVHHVSMPEDRIIIVGFYNEEGTLLKAFVNPEGEMEIAASYAVAYAFDSSLSPLCDSYIMNMQKGVA